MSASSIPVLRGHPLLGVLPELRRDVPALLSGAHRRLGDVVRLRAPGLAPLFSLAHPDAVRRVLVERADSFARSPFHDRLKPVLGEGLLTSEPPLWRAQRRLIQPAFQAAAMRGHLAVMADEAERFAGRWCAVPGGVLDANEAFSDLALAVVTRALFGSGSDQEAIAAAVDTMRRVIARRMFQPVPLPLSWPLPAHRRFHRASAVIEAEVGRLLEGDAAAETSVIGRLAAAPDATPEQVRDEVITLFLAGHESSAGGLAWACYLLGDRPDLQDRLAAEAEDASDAASGLHDPTDALPLARAVAMEALRLYPSAAWFARKVEVAEEVAGVALARGTVVLVSPYVTQRDARWWPEPERFDPARFLPDAPKPAPLTYFPFGAGPRTCVGLQFALAEITLAIAALTRHAHFHCLERDQVVAHSAITLRPAPRLLLALEPRG